LVPEAPITELVGIKQGDAVLGVGRRGVALDDPARRTVQVLVTASLLSVTSPALMTRMPPAV
jgi:hypothetical protein